MRIAVELQPLLKEKSGVGWYNYNLIKMISNKNLEITGEAFNFMGRNDITNAIAGLGIDVDICRYIPYGIYYRIWDSIPFNYNSLFKSRADIHHFFNFVVPPRIKGKVITTIYDMVYKIYPDTMTKANYTRLDRNIKRSANRADIIVTISENSKKEIIQYLQVPEDKIKIVNPGVELDIYNKVFEKDKLAEVKRKYNLPNEYILYLGTLEPRKNIESIIAGYARYKSQHENTRLKLVLAGKKGWMYESIFQSAKANKLTEDIIFTGYVEEKDKPIIYKLSKMFLFPSLYEGFGMPVLEAMAAGVPVITSNISSLPEVVGDAGILIEPRSIQDIADSIFTLENDLELRKEFIFRGRKRSQQYTWNKSAGDLIQIYKELGAE